MNPDADSCLGLCRFHDGTVYSLDVFSPEEYNINVDTGYRGYRKRGGRVEPEEQDPSSRGIILVTGSHDQTISMASIQRVHSKEDGYTVKATKTATLSGHTSDVYALEVLPEIYTADGTTRVGHLLSAGDYTLRTWDLEKKTLRSTFSGHTGYIACIKIRGKRAFSGSWDTTIRSWNLETGKAMHVFKGHTNIVNCLDVTNTDLFSGSWDQTIIQWSRSTGDPVQSFRGHTDGVQCLQVFEDNLYSGSMDKTIRVWSIATGKLIRTMKGHMAGIECLHVVDGVCFTGSYDKTVRCFNVDTGECIRLFEGHTDGIYCIKYYDGLLFSGSGDKSVRVWDASFLQIAAKKSIFWCCSLDTTK
ncbi:WD40 repeat-like protein [Rhizoclosmatium globosum]|uniref:WD40 repeat-like protein n=1 Tax=Rhizoclosmatium globosum TaxID=329046 RepID=A0A1Y2C708_9FUNG|nr:WD40 repeat-like protein [Rhizoclosmatium globosum]|eukprot:ORY42818.1 WD40 repeat-like protein [Rhizoclosmatium globosum]